MTSPNLSQVLSAGRGTVAGSGSATLTLTPGLHTLSLRYRAVPGGVPFRATLVPSGATPGTYASRLTAKTADAQARTDGLQVRDLSSRSTLDGLIQHDMVFEVLASDPFEWFLDVDTTNGGEFRDGRVSFERMAITTSAALTSNLNEALKTTAPKRSIITAFGQSALTGFGTAISDLAISGIDRVNSRVSERQAGVDYTSLGFYAGGVAGTIAPLQLPSQGANGGYIDCMSRSLSVYADRNSEIEEVILYNGAIPNTSFVEGNWSPGDTAFDDYETKLVDLEAAAGCPIGAIVVALGYNDARNGNTAAGFQADMLAAITQLRSNFSYDIPVIVMGLAGFNLLSDAFREIQEVMENCSTWLTNSTYVSVEDLVGTADGVHNSAADNRTIGVRLAQAYDRMIDYGQLNQPGTTIVKHGYTVVSGGAGAQTVVTFDEPFPGTPNVTIGFQYNYAAGTNASLTDRFVAINLVAPTAFRVINSANVNVLDGFHWIAAYTV